MVINLSVPWDNLWASRVAIPLQKMLLLLSNPASTRESDGRIDETSGKSEDRIESFVRSG
jgi:hypothetical protein